MLYRPLPALPEVPRGRPLVERSANGADALRRASTAGPPGEGGGSDAHKEPTSGSRSVLSLVALVGAAFVAALLIKFFLFETFVIPTGSMTPTLGIGDRVLVNKLSYDLHDVNRGDLVVFERPPAARRPGDDSDLIKRVIGLPGETIEARGGVVFVDGEDLPERYLPASVTTPDFPRYELGEYEVFVMGDNRQASRDSRVFGPVEEKYLIGRAFLRLWPLSEIGLL